LFFGSVRPTTGLAVLMVGRRRGRAARPVTLVVAGEF
jgi:hypothetical protein